MATFVGLEDFYNILKQDPARARKDIGHFNIFNIEDFPKHRPASYSRRDFFKVSFVTGHSKIHYADKCIEVKDSALVFTNPMIPYYWEKISNKHTGYVCIFTETFFNGFGKITDYPVFQHSDAAVIRLTKDENEIIKQRFDRMYEELQSTYTYKYDLLRSLLIELIHTAQKMQPASGAPSADPNASTRLAGLFTELLERQFPLELTGQTIKLNTPAAFAQRLNIHINHLNKALKQSTGRTTSQLIHDRLLEESKILLKSSDWTVADIAWGLGFKEPNHFSGFFKTRTGLTPSKFREQPS